MNNRSRKKNAEDRKWQEAKKRFTLSWTRLLVLLDQTTEMNAAFYKGMPSKPRKRLSLNKAADFQSRLEVLNKSIGLIDPNGRISGHYAHLRQALEPIYFLAQNCQSYEDIVGFNADEPRMDLSRKDIDCIWFFASALPPLFERCADIVEAACSWLALLTSELKRIMELEYAKPVQRVPFDRHLFATTFPDGLPWVRAA